MLLLQAVLVRLKKTLSGSREKQQLGFAGGLHYIDLVIVAIRASKESTLCSVTFF